ncbi:MAG TPA: hypothetical protein VGG65_09975, partial [Thermoanaerobaculia bacterium]
MEASPPARQAWGWFVPALLASTAVAKAVLAWAYPGFSSGDDLEIVETAAHYAIGFPYEPWGIRSLLHPIVLAAPFVWMGNLFGMRGPEAAVVLATIPTTLFSTASIWIVWRLTRALGWSESVGRASAFLYAAHSLTLAYGAMPYPRPVSTALLLGAFLLLAPREVGRGAAFAAGIACAAAMAVRWSEGVMILPLLAFGAWRARRVAVIASVLAGFVVGLAVFAGLFDLWTWGRPFASLVAFVRFCLDPSAWGWVRPPRRWYWYGSNILGWAGPILVLLTVCALKDARARLPLAIAATAVALLSFSPVKQPRYMQIVIPFLAMAAALGWEALRRSLPWLATVVLIAAVPVGLERTLHLLRRKSLSATAAARALADMSNPPRAVALEQAWAYGERLYLGPDASLRDVAPRTPLPVETVLAAASGAQALALYTEDSSPELERALGNGWRRCETLQIADSPGVTLYVPVGNPCPRVRPGEGLTAAQPRS